LGPGLLFGFVIFLTQPVELLGGVVRHSQGRCLHTGQHKHRINAHRHPCFQWIRTHDPRVWASEDSWCLRLRPPWSADIALELLNIKFCEHPNSRSWGCSVYSDWTADGVANVSDKGRQRNGYTDKKGKRKIMKNRKEERSEVRRKKRENKLNEVIN
jgi:hypothetical protein